MKPTKPTMPLNTLSDDELAQQLRRAVQALPDAPLHLQRAAIGLWPGPAAPAGGGLLAQAQGMLTHIAAALSFDSWAAPAVALGMRSLRSPTRHLLFSAQGRDIDLRISPVAGATQGQFAVAGQVLGPDDVGVVELAAEGAKAGAVHRTSLDAMGEFRIDGLAAGRYNLTLQMGSDAIELPPLEVGEPTA
jgi:hypothetical protein